MNLKLHFFSIAFFLTLFASAQTCPTLAGPLLQDDVYAIQFNVGSNDPNDYPLTITATTGTTDVVYHFDQIDSAIVHYHLPDPGPWTGTKIDANDFTVDFGLGAGGCHYVGSVLPISNFELTSTFNLYPNPVVKGGSITITSPNSSLITGAIFDVTGKQVLQINTTEKVDISSLNQGFYFVKLVSENTIITKKIIIIN